MLLALLCFLLRASAAEDTEARAQLKAAVQEYVDGNAAEARQALQILLGQGPDLPADVRLEALAWLGDILYSEEGSKSARTAFEALLSENPKYILDSFQHPPEVVAYFETLRAQLAPTTALPPVLPPITTPSTPPMFPSLILVPGGVYYYTQGRPGLGATLTVLQLGSLASSAVLYSQLVAMPDEVEVGDEALIQRSSRLRALNWVVAGTGWAALSVPILLETTQWGRAQVEFKASPTSIGVQGSF